MERGACLHNNSTTLQVNVLIYLCYKEFAEISRYHKGRNVTVKSLPRILVNGALPKLLLDEGKNAHCRRQNARRRESDAINELTVSVRRGHDVWRVTAQCSDVIATLTS